LKEEFILCIAVAHTLKYKSERTLRNLTDLKATLSVNDFGVWCLVTSIDTSEW